MTTVRFHFDHSELVLSCGDKFWLRGDLELKTGQPTVLVGENGAGKSLTLGALSYLSQDRSQGPLTPVECVKPALVQMAHADGGQSAPVGVGLVRQEPIENFISQIAADEIMLSLVNSHRSTEEIQERVEKLLDMPGLEPGLLDAPICRLSSGQQQFLAVVSALASDPQLVLLDEAFARLDGERASLATTLLRTACPEAFIVAATHQPADFVRLFKDAQFVLVSRDDKLITLAPCDPPPLDPSGTGPLAITTAGSEAAVVRGTVSAVSRFQGPVFTRTRIQIHKGINYISGRNGSGKTVALQILAGLIPINPVWRFFRTLVATGDLHRTGGGSLVSQSRRGRTAYLPGEPSSWLASFSVHDQLTTFTGTAPTEETTELLARLGIEPTTDLDVLSYGQAKVVAFLSVPVELDLVCLDEPLASMSTMTQRAVAGIVRRRVESGAWPTVIVASNQLSTLQELLGVDP